MNPKLFKLSNEVGICGTGSVHSTEMAKTLLLLTTLFAELMNIPHDLTVLSLQILDELPGMDEGVTSS